MPEKRSDPRTEIEDLLRLLEEGDRKIVQQLDEINRLIDAGESADTAEDLLIAMMDAQNTQRDRLNVLIALANSDDSSK